MERANRKVWKLGVCTSRAPQLQIWAAEVSSKLDKTGYTSIYRSNIQVAAAELTAAAAD